MQAAIGVAQLERLDEFIKLKRLMGARYNDMMQHLPAVQLPLPRTDYAENIYWVYGLVLDEALNMDAEEAMNLLTERGVGCRPFFWPMHKQPVLQRMGMFDDEPYPVAERLGRRGFYLPSGLTLNPSQQERVVEILQEVLHA